MMWIELAAAVLLAGGWVVMGILICKLIKERDMLEDYVLGQMAKEAVVEAAASGEKPRAWEDLKKKLGPGKIHTAKMAGNPKVWREIGHAPEFNINIEKEVPPPRPKKMDDAHYRALLDLIMASDPWPDGVDQDAAIALADEEAKLRGLNSWVVAYHEL